jgi:hypothetical protein
VSGNFEALRDQFGHAVAVVITFSACGGPETNSVTFNPENILYPEKFFPAPQSRVPPDPGGK